MNTHGKPPPGKEATPVAATHNTAHGTRKPAEDLPEEMENTVIGNIGHAPEGPDADPDPSVVPLTTTMGGLTTRGEYATDPATGGGRYMGHGTGTFGMDPMDPPNEDRDAIDPKI